MLAGVDDALRDRVVHRRNEPISLLSDGDQVILRGLRLGRGVMDVNSMRASQCGEAIL
jgi:hypothetical protein